MPVYSQCQSIATAVHKQSDDRKVNLEEDSLCVYEFRNFTVQLLSARAHITVLTAMSTFALVQVEHGALKRILR